MSNRRARVSRRGGGRTVRVYNGLTGREERFDHVVVSDAVVREWQALRWLCVAHGVPNRPPDSCAFGNFHWNRRDGDEDLAASFRPIVRDPRHLVGLWLQPFTCEAYAFVMNGAHLDDAHVEIPSAEPSVVTGAAAGALECVGERIRVCFALSIEGRSLTLPTERFFDGSIAAMDWLAAKMDHCAGESGRVLVAGVMYGQALASAA